MIKRKDRKTEEPTPAAAPNAGPAGEAAPVQTGGPAPAVNAAADAALAELRKQVDQLTADKAQLQDRFLRLQADYANYQKRVARQISDSVEYERRSIMRSLLSSLDHFGMALAGAAGAGGPQSADSLAKGVQIVLDHLLDALKKHGVERIESVGKPFDPAVHEAIMQRSEPDKPDGVVLEECQAAYLLNGQTLRAGRVIVNKVAPAAPAGGEQAEKG